MNQKSPSKQQKFCKTTKGKNRLKAKFPPGVCKHYYLVRCWYKHNDMFASDSDQVSFRYCLGCHKNLRGTGDALAAWTVGGAEAGDNLYWCSSCEQLSCILGRNDRAGIEELLDTLRRESMNAYTNHGADQVFGIVKVKKRSWSPTKTEKEES